MNKSIDITSATIWRFVMIGILLFLLFVVRDILLLLFVSIIVVSAIQPIVDKLQEKKVPRAVSAVIIYLVLLSFIIGLIYIIAPLFSSELKQLGSNIPQYFEGIESFFQNISAVAASYNFGANLESIINNFSDAVSSFVSQIFSNTFKFFGGLFSVLIVFSLSFYMLVKKDGIKSFLKNVFPQRFHSYVISLNDRIQYKTGRWLVGQTALILIIFFLDYVVLFALGIPYALILAIIGGLMEIIPYVGPVVAIIPATLIALTVSPWKALLVLIGYIAIQQLENYVLTPLVMKKAVGLNPVMIILALLIGGKLAGVLGVILAVPFATALNVFVQDLLMKKGDKETQPE